MTPLTRNLWTLLAFLMLYLAAGCAVENPEDAKKFKYNFQGQTFRQIKYRSLKDSNLYKFHSGIREILFDPAEYTSTFQNYTEFSVVPCYGSAKGKYTPLSKEAFLEEVNDTGVDETDSDGDGVYDIFDPYGPQDPVTQTPTDRVDLVEYFFIIDITANGITPGCPIHTDSKLYYQFLFYQNGDLVLRDYNREIEFFMRPITK